MKSLALILVAFLSLSAFGQQVDKQARLRDILEEKMRFPYEKLVEMYNAKQSNTGVTTPVSNAGTSAIQNKKSVTELRLSALSSTDIDEGEAFIAINPNDSNHLIVSYMEFNQTGMGTPLKFPIYYTKDGGLSWTKSSFLTEDIFAADLPTEIIGGGGDPVFAFDNTGKIYFSWLYLGIDVPNDRASFVMNWAYSTDDGATFSVEPDSAHFIGSGELVNLSTGGIISDRGDGVFDRQWMDVDRSGGVNEGRLYVTSLFVPNDSTKLSGLGTVVRIKESGNALFDVDNYSVSPDVNTQFGNVAVDGNGTAHVTYANTSLMEVKYSKRGATDLTFTAPVTIASGRLFPRPGPYHNRSNGALNLVADPVNDNLYACYSDFTTLGTVRSFFMRSTNSGTTWSTPRNISDFTDSNVVLMPTVSAYNGNVSLSYYDIDSINRFDKKGLHKTIQSIDNGLTWLSPRTLSSDTTQFGGSISARWFGDYNNAVRTPCRTFSVWSDGRSGSSTKMYIAITDNCQELGLTEVSPFQSNISVGNAFPNPANKQFSLSINCLAKTAVTVQILDLKGAVVLSYPQETKEKGAHTLNFNLDSNLPKGTYLIQVKSGNDGFTRKLIIQ